MKNYWGGSSRSKDGDVPSHGGSRGGSPSEEGKEDGQTRDPRSALYSMHTTPMMSFPDWSDEIGEGRHREATRTSNRPNPVPIPSQSPPPPRPSHASKPSCPGFSCRWRLFMQRAARRAASVPMSAVSRTLIYASRLVDVENEPRERVDAPHDPVQNVTYVRHFFSIYPSIIPNTSY